MKNRSNIDTPADNVRLFGRIEKRHSVSIGRLIKWVLLYCVGFGAIGSLAPMMSDKFPHSPFVWAVAFGLGGIVKAVIEEVWDVPYLQGGFITIAIYLFVTAMLVSI